jgi:hypothetical protein
MKSSANLNLYLWNPDAFQAYGVEFVVMMFNATFNNISIISQRSVLLVEDTGENLVSVNKNTCLGIRRRCRCQSFWKSFLNLFINWFTYYLFLWWKRRLGFFFATRGDFLMSLFDQRYLSLVIFNTIIPSYRLLWRTHLSQRFAQIGGFLRCPPPTKLTAAI